MNKKKEGKAKNGALKDASDTPEAVRPISSRAELKTFLLSVRDRLEDETAAPIYALTALNHVMNLAEIGEYLDQENKELARDIWLRIRQSGMQVRKPVMLFGVEADGAPPQTR